MRVRQRDARVRVQRTRGRALDPRCADEVSKGRVNGLSEFHGPFVETLVHLRGGGGGMA